MDHRLRRCVALALFAAMPLVGAACSDDDNDGESELEAPDVDVDVQPDDDSNTHN